MSDDIFKDGNPFAKLNKKAFPSLQENREAKKEAVLRAMKADLPIDDADDDSTMFLRAVSNASELIDKTERYNERFGESLSIPQKKRKKDKEQARPNEAQKASTSKKTPEKSASQGMPAFLQSPPEDVESFAAMLEKNMASLKANAPRNNREQEKLKPKPKHISLPKNQSEEADEDSLAMASMFADAMKDVSRLDGKGRIVAPEPIHTETVAVPEQNLMQDFMDGKIEFSLSATDEYVEAHVVGLDLAIAAKLQQGQFSPEAHLDLHGLNSSQAFEALVGFIRNAYMCGKRTVLVVSGRGKNSPEGIGVLREKLQEWFTQDPFRRVILAFCTAKVSDGGSGALYVLLRKFRKDKGKVYWDRRPSDADIY